MGQAHPLSLSNNSFDPPTLHILGAAYDLAVANLHDTEQPDAVRARNAIMASAMSGKRDFRMLCQAALRGIASPTRFRDLPL